MLLFGTTASKPVKLEPSCRAILPRTLIVPLLCTHLNEAYDVQIGNNKFQNFSAKIFSGRFTADLNLENFLIGLYEKSKDVILGSNLDRQQSNEKLH